MGVYVTNKNNERLTGFGMKYFQQMLIFVRNTTLGVAAALVLLPLASFAGDNEESFLFNLEEVVVTGTRSLRILKDVPIETNVVTRNEMEQAGVKDAADAIRMVPGLSISGGAPLGGNRRLTGLIRGLPAHYSLLLIDGKRTKSEHIHTGINMNVVPVEMIERIEVIKGPASAIYGSDAFGGVINIITRKFPGKHLFNLDTSYGTFNTGNMGITYGSQAGKLDYTLSGKMVNTGAFDGYRQRNLMAKAEYKLSEKNILDMSAKYYLNGYNKSGVPATDSLFDFTMGLRRDYGGNSSLKVDGYFCDFNQDAKETGNTTVEMDAVYHNDFSKKHSITAGVEMKRDDFKRLATPAKCENIYSTFVEEEIKLSDRFNYVAALRVDLHPGLNPIFTPKVNFLYKAAEKTSLRFEAGTGFRAPSLQDRYEYHYWHKTYWRDGNPDLKPEYSVSFNLGVEQRFIEDRLMGRLSLFRNNITDMINVTADLGLDPNDGQQVYGRENLATAFTQGAEIEFRWRVFNPLDVIFCYNFLDAKDDEGKVLSYNPEHSFNLRFYSNWDDAGIVMYLSMESAVNRFYKDKEGSVEPLDDYTLLNFNLIKKVIKSLDVYLTVGNILNQSFESYEEGKAETSLGRTFTFGVKYKL